MDAGVSTFEGAAVTLGLDIAAFFCSFFVLRYAVDLGNMATGAANGVTNPLRMRWAAIYHGVIPALTFLVVFHLLIAVGLVTMAEGTAGSLEWFMKASAVWVGAGGVFGILFYSVYVHHLIAALREETS